MRLKTKLVLAITGLVFLVVTVLSWLFLEQLLAQRISQSYAANDMVAAADPLLHPARASTMDCAAQPARSQRSQGSARAVAGALQHDQGLNEQLSAVNRYSPTVFDVAIADRDGKALAEHRSHPGQRRAAQARRTTTACSARRRLHHRPHVLRAAAQLRHRAADRTQGQHGHGAALPQRARGHPHHLPAHRLRALDLGLAHLHRHRHPVLAPGGRFARQPRPAAH